MKTATIINNLKLRVNLAKVCVLFFIIVASLAVSYLHAAWTPPTDTFPNGNVDIPINIGANVQVKAGGTIGVDTLISNDVEIGDDAAPGSSMILDVNGHVGAVSYCDEAGASCTAPLPNCAAGQVVVSDGAGGWSCAAN